jgi:hypothetical protein
MMRGHGYVWLVILQNDVPDTCSISSHDSTQNITKGEESSDMEEAENPVPFVFPEVRKPEHKVSCISVLVHNLADFTNIWNCLISIFMPTYLSIDMNWQASCECVLKVIFVKCLKRILFIRILFVE